MTHTTFTQNGAETAINGRPRPWPVTILTRMIETLPRGRA
jgi:hypothetical protein